MSLKVNIRKRLGNFNLDVAFETERGVFAILGASGCGKSMTLKCIAGIETPDEGRIELNGRVLYDSAKKINLTPQKRRVGYMFQDYALFPNMTVEQNIKAGMGKHPEEEKVRSYINRFRLEGMEKHYPAQLSGGQKQRVAMARMIASEPDILLLDEPFSALDSYLKWELEQEMRDMLAEVQKPVLDLRTAIDHETVVHPEDDILNHIPVGQDYKRNVCVSYHKRVGDIEAELAKCDYVVEGTYFDQATRQSAMEPFQSFGYIDHLGRIVIVSSTQIVFHVRRHIARALGIPASKIRVIKPRIGGGFGSKQTACTELMTAFVTWKLQKPCYLLYDRTEAQTCSTTRHAREWYIRVGATKDGIIQDFATEYNTCYHAFLLVILCY